MASKLDLADAQFIGYSHGKDGRVVDMVISMGLTRGEWKKWKEKYTNSYLTDNEMRDIDDHFKLDVFERLGD